MFEVNTYEAQGLTLTIEQDSLSHMDGLPSDWSAHIITIAVRSARTATNWAKLRKCCWQIMNVGSVPRILVVLYSHWGKNTEAREAKKSISKRQPTGEVYIWIWLIFQAWPKLD